MPHTTPYRDNQPFYGQIETAPRKERGRVGRFLHIGHAGEYHTISQKNPDIAEVRENMHPASLGTDFGSAGGARGAFGARRKSQLVLAVLAVLAMTACHRAPAPLPESVWKPYSVADFGAKGDGRTDDTDAIQRCITTVEQSQIAHRGNPKFSDYNHETAYPEILFPAGTYVISRTIVVAAKDECPNLALRGVGKVTLNQKNPDQDILYFHHGYRQSIENLGFTGGQIQIKFISWNLNRAQLVVRNCRFADSGSYAIDDSLKGVHHSKIVAPYTLAWKEGVPYATRVDVEALPDVWFNSTILHIDQCEFIRCKNVARLFSDWGTISGSRIVTHPEMAGAAIYSRGVLKISDTHVQAETRAGRPQRFVDNINAGVILYRVTIEAEGAGMCAIYNRCIYDNGGLYNNYAVIDDCRIKAAGSEENCWVYCEEVPNLIRITNSTELSGKAIPAIGFRQPITKEYLRHVSYPDLVKRLPELAQIYGHLVAMPRVYDIPDDRFSNNFSFSLYGNTNLTDTLPEPMRQFVENPLPARILAEFSSLANRASLQLPEAKRQLNAADFGADGKRNQDDTLAIKAAVAAASDTGSELLFPGGVYRISQTIELPESLTIRGLGLAVFMGDKKVLFRGRNVRHIAFVNAGFYQADVALDLTTPVSKDAGILFDHCTFSGISGAAIRCLASDGKTGVKNQTKLRVTDSMFEVQGRALVADADDALFDYNWLSMVSTPVLGTLVNYGTMRILDCIGVPDPESPNSWIENSGTLFIDNMRFGGEGVLAKDLVTNNHSEGRIFMRYSWLCCHRGSVIICNKPPKLLALANNLGPPDKQTQTLVALKPEAAADVKEFLFETGNIPPTNFKTLNDTLNIQQP